MAIEFEYYRVTATLIEPMLGTVSKHTKSFEEYIGPRVFERLDGDVAEKLGHAYDLDQLAAEEMETAPQSDDRGYTGFHSDSQGPFIYDYMVRGFLKEAGNNLRDMIGVANLRSKIDKYLFITPRRIRLPQIDPEPYERPLRAMTMQGPRVTLVKSDLVDAGAQLEFGIKVIPIAEINKATKERVHLFNIDMLKTMLDYGELVGLGQFRNGSFGRFTYTIERAWQS